MCKELVVFSFVVVIFQTKHYRSHFATLKVLTHRTGSIVTTFGASQGKEAGSEIKKCPCAVPIGRAKCRHGTSRLN